MFKQTRYFRWLILLFTVVVEAFAFWYGGAPVDPALTFSQAVTEKLRDPIAWTWVGWASLSMAWLWAELAFVFFSDGRRARALLSRSGHEELIYDTGVHWLVLLRDIHLNQLNDGEETRLEEGLFPNNAKRSFAWYAIWLPILLAIATLLYFLGWATWSLRQVPDIVETWLASGQIWMEERLTGPASIISDPLIAVASQLTLGLQTLHGLARDNGLITLGAIIAIWFVARVLARGTDALPLVPYIFKLLARFSVLAGLFALFSTPWFDWLAPLYSIAPHHGIVAMGFFPLTLASAFYFPHILFWSSWRYAILRDRETYDATLMRLGGVFNSLQQRINLQRIVDTDIFQMWWQRLFNVGDIELKQMGGGEPERVRHVYGPNILLDEIRNAIREGKKRAGPQQEFDGDEMDRF